MTGKFLNETFLLSIANIAIFKPIFDIEFIQAIVIFVSQALITITTQIILKKIKSQKQKKNETTSN